MKDKKLTENAVRKLIGPLPGDRVEERDKRVPKKFNIGRKTKLSYGEWFIQVFLVNEDQEKGDRWNDATIANMAAKEFPDKEKKHRRRQQKQNKPNATDGIQDVARYRAHYHKQTIHQFQKRPAILSCRYNNVGNPIDQHKKHLTFEKFQKRCRLFKIKDSRLKDPPIGFFEEED